MITNQLYGEMLKEDSQNLQQWVYNMTQLFDIHSILHVSFTPNIIFFIAVKKNYDSFEGSILKM